MVGCKSLLQIVFNEEYIDLSRTIEHLVPVYPGDPPTHLQHVSDFTQNGYTAYHLSPDRPPHEIHTLLLENDVLIAENLCNLDQLLPAKAFEIIALPLRIHADSSPARIIA